MGVGCAEYRGGVSTIGEVDEYAMPVSASEEAVAVGHVDQGAAFNAVLVAHVETDVVLYVELPEAFVVL